MIALQVVLYVINVAQGLPIITCKLFLYVACTQCTQYSQQALETTHDEAEITGMFIKICCDTGASCEECSGMFANTHTNSNLLS